MTHDADVDARLHAEDWSRLGAQLTVVCWKILRRRSWSDARDLAHEAIARVFERKHGWDPDRVSLLRHLARVAWGIAGNERRDRRHRVEIRVSDEEREAVWAESDLVDVRVERRQMTDTFCALLTARLARDATALRLLELKREGIETPAEQARVSGFPLEEIRRARRRLFDHAEKVARVLEMKEVAS